MKTTFYPHDKRGGGNYGWLQTKYSFSFNTWYDEDKMGFGVLRVLNDDVITRGEGFGRHGHKDMEIITIVMRGAVVHEDSIGNKRVVYEGDVQVMSAGKGVMHSEMNDSTSNSLELFQLWIKPKELSIKPLYAKKNYGFKSITDDIVELVGKNSLPINQDAFIFYGALSDEKAYTYTVKDIYHGVYIFVIQGAVEIHGHILEARDALGVSDTGDIILTSKETSTFLIVEVPMH